MKKNVIYIIICILFIFRSTENVYADFYINGQLLTTGVLETTVCPLTQYTYNVRNTHYQSSDVIWTIKHGKFQNGSSQLLGKKLLDDIIVIWDDECGIGELTYKVINNGSDTPSASIGHIISSARSLHIPNRVKTNVFPVVNNTISILYGNSGSFTITLPDLYFSGGSMGSDWYKVQNFMWTIPSSLGGNNIPTIGGYTKTIYYDGSSGNNAQIIVKARSTCNDKTGEAFTITIKRVSTLNGIIQNQNITSTVNYEYSDLYIENTNIYSGANVTFNGYSTVSIQSGFHALPGSNIRIYNEAPVARMKRKSSSSDDYIASDQQEAKLYQNTPNPFYGQTSISCYIPENTQHSYLKIFNSLGKMIEKIEIKERGNCNIEIPGTSLAPGIYIYSLEINNHTIDTKRMIIIN